MATEALQGLPYPAGTAAPNVPADLQALAAATAKNVVMRFASAAARTSAFTAAGVTATEGMLSYLLDLDRYETHDGSNWVPLFNFVDTSAFAGGGNYASTGTTEIVGLTLASYKFKSASAYRVFVTTGYYGDALDVTPQFRLRQTNAAGTLLWDWYRVRTLSSGIVSGWSGTAIVKNTTAADLTRTLVFTFNSNTATQSRLYGDSVGAYIDAEYIGPSSKYAGGGVLS